MLSFECIKNEKSVYFLLTSADCCRIDGVICSVSVLFYFVGQIENKSYFLPNQAIQTRENSIKNKSCYLIWTYRKSVLSDAPKIRKIWAKDA